MQSVHSEEFFSEYSRPNDDRFQNAAGASGEPYEVSRVRVSLITENGTEGINLSFKWTATMTTGRHVEAGAYFSLYETASDIFGARPGRSLPLQITYPKGATAQSSFERKIGSLLHATMELGTVQRDGTYSGELQIRNRGVGGNEESTTGITQLTGRQGSTFQTARWRLRIVDGKISEVSVECQRFAEPLMRLVESNWTRVDASRRENQPYPRQPKAAKCKSETVGKEGEELGAEQTEIQELTARLAPMISEAGCLDCHAEGNENNFRFCDDGTPIYPESDAHNIFALITNPAETDWDSYPTGMKRAIERLTAAEKDSGVVSKWAFKHGVSPGLNFSFQSGIACNFDLTFRNLSGRVIHQAPMSQPPLETTISAALAASCRQCLDELQTLKRNILSESEHNVFLTYACVLPRLACESRLDGVGYSVDKRGLQRALSALGNPEATSLCRIE